MTLVQVWLRVLTPRQQKDRCTPDGLDQQLPACLAAVMQQLTSPPPPAVAAAASAMLRPRLLPAEAAIHINDCTLSLFYLWSQTKCHDEFKIVMEIHA